MIRTHDIFPLKIIEKKIVLDQNINQIDHLQKHLKGVTSSSPIFIGYGIINKCVMKTLIFGPANAGKTSLMRTTCQGYTFFRVMKIPPTRGISRENFLFRGLLAITIWDAGGQDKYIDRYFSENQREIVFSEVEIPIYVVDTSAIDEKQKIIFQQFVKNLNEFSPDIKKIYVLLNKTDLENADPDRSYNNLLKDLTPKLKDLCAFTPVSVKEGTAQHRLIEILDYALQNSVLELEKLKEIRTTLEQMKANINCDFILFNRPDGLITTSTIGKIKTDPLNFLSLDIGVLESNIDLIFSRIQSQLGNESSPLSLSSYIYETENEYVVFREIEDYAMIMVISHGKSLEILGQILKEISGSEKPFQDLNNMISHR
jgi:GTPase SAR1 family protein